MCWMCRFFDRMNFCFVTFLLVALLLWFQSSNLISREIGQILIDLIITSIVIVILYESFFTQRTEGKNKLVTSFHNIAENIIAIFAAFIWPFMIIYLILYFSALLLGITSDYISREIYYYLIFFTIILISIFETICKQRKGNESSQSKEDNQSNLIMSLHDILRNFIVIFAVLIWPIVFLYFDRNRISYVTFYGIEKLQFPVYIIAASFIGVLSYLLLSIEETFGHLIPEYEKISIAWSYLRRIFIAPFIAIIGFYVLNDLQNRDEFSEINDYFVFVFSFFAGVFTKTIEEWIYAWVQKLLPGDKKEEFSARIKYEVKKSDFVKILGCDEDLAYMLYNAKIRTIEELASFKDECELMKRVNLDTRNLGEGTGCPLKNRAGTLGSYKKEQLQLYIHRAKYYTEMGQKSDLVIKLKMDRDLAFKLCLRAGIKDTDGLKNCDPKYVHKKICDYKKESQEAHDRLCECSEEVIQNFKEKAKKKKKKKNRS